MAPSPSGRSNRLTWNILSMFRGAKIINIERNDAVDQAVSMSIAKQTKSWSSEQGTATDPEYDYSDRACPALKTTLRDGSLGRR
ncbi:MAG: hypothetical protein DI616_12910 [Paracoccus denitrificans]|uniref:Sulphotransferase Stf0 domain-containing protein n=1 Tax=Paracoccus denitrificans TaxID=266 RepID=A0A533I2A6_PARDE|nr:MAG: hypothetical protein DI616_12910 [Paracoccus denitrificans]